MGHGPSKANAGSPRKVVLVLSGGLDSTVLAHRLRAEGCDLTMLSFNYGQSHRRELEFAYRSAASLGGAHRVIQLGAITELLAGSSLTDPAVATPDGHYSDSSMRATVVPNRNAILLDVAVAHAVAVGASAVAFGAHAGDHPIYPDCRPSFVAAYEQMVRVANEGFIDPDFAVLAPFIDASKSKIVAEGARLGVPFEDTWSCYRGGARHCGRCGTCVERREAFFVADVADPTEYEVP
ncbi:7-cyano-7-deazaguanine synthase QueC [Solwaraspora sp. WMMD406]|uniref:7-cyano-7-deazaguanine synthase QueC n=1 Tax=Solwaraspora sp. WMMD406 TaxID=3016095 RepID=UPI00241646F7|nr:7-cyano-7-deazaguanine synthase QueC [Solwaraspora sp. WMMD406]MDG4764441.1 7-cyano-7-deazaguanine synthase QueC [Solwaraspora sp. WMMD406]